MLYVIALINWGCGPLSSLTTVLHGMVRVAGWELTEKNSCKRTAARGSTKNIQCPKIHVVPDAFQNNSRCRNQPFSLTILYPNSCKNINADCK